MPTNVSYLPRGIYKRDPESAIYHIRYRDARGRLRREKAGTLKMAEDLLEIREIEKLRRKLPGNKGGRIGVQVSELIDDCINYAFANNDEVSAHDLRLKLERIRLTFGDKDVAKVTRQSISDWLDAESAIRNWKPATRNRYQSAFSLMFRIAIENGKAHTNPAKGVKHKQEDNGRIRYLHQVEEKALLDALKPLGQGEVHSLVLSLHTGMRLSEQNRSLVGDYDPHTKILMVRQKKNRRGPAVRHVPLTPIAIEAYEALAKGKKPGDSLCEEVTGNIKYWFPSVVEAAGIKDYTWHCNRHTFCSRLVMSGVPIAAVAQFAGHSSVQMTMRYSHLMPRANEQAVASMMSFYESA